MDSPERVVGRDEALTVDLGVTGPGVIVEGSPLGDRRGGKDPDP